MRPHFFFYHELYLARFTSAYLSSADGEVLRLNPIFLHPQDHFSLTMPAVQPPATVLVTGVSGFTGIWIARALLEHQYVVRGTVRSEKKAAYVAELFKSHGERFKPVVLPDISEVSIPSLVVTETCETCGLLILEYSLARCV